MLFVNVERPRAFSAQLTSFTCFGGFKGQSQIKQSRLLLVESHTDMPERPPLCSLSVFKPIVWFVSSLGGLVWARICWQHQRSGGTHLAGHLVEGDGADTISQSWNVPGSLNLGCFLFSRLPDKTGCLVSFVLFCFYQRHIRWFPLSD